MMQFQQPFESISAIPHQSFDQKTWDGILPLKPVPVEEVMREWETFLFHRQNEERRMIRIQEFEQDSKTSLIQNLIKHQQYSSTNGINFSAMSSGNIR